MSRYIDAIPFAQAVSDLRNKEREEYDNLVGKHRSLARSIHGQHVEFCEKMLKAIREQPTLDAVTVVHGHWEIVPNDDNRDDHYKMRCSVCGETLWSIHSEELYCCKCGAKMDDYDDGERREYEQIHKG